MPPIAALCLGHGIGENVSANLNSCKLQIPEFAIASYEQMCVHSIIILIYLLKTAIVTQLIISNSNCLFRMKMYQRPSLLMTYNRTDTL